MWTVLREGDRNARRQRRVWARCTCGTEKLVRYDHIKSGRGKSCGCSPRPRVEPFVRFWGHVEKGSGCWVWRGTAIKGYGVLYLDSKRRMRASRASWVIHNGGIPPGMNVLHRCDNPACVRPDHLFLGTEQDNSTDMVNKGRHCFGSHNKLAKLDDSRVRQIKARLLLGEVGAVVAREFGVSRSTVSLINRGLTWRHVI